MEIPWDCSWEGTSWLVTGPLSPCGSMDLPWIWYEMDRPVVLSDLFSLWSTDHEALESRFFLPGKQWWPPLDVCKEDHYPSCLINLEGVRLVQFCPSDTISALWSQLAKLCYNHVGWNFSPRIFPPGWKVAKYAPGFTESFSVTHVLIGVELAPQELFLTVRHSCLAQPWMYSCYKSHSTVSMLVPFDKWSLPLKNRHYSGHFHVL